MIEKYDPSEYIPGLSPGQDPALEFRLIFRSCRIAILQLELIDALPDRITRAATIILKAKMKFRNWHKNGLISDVQIRDYENALESLVDDVRQLVSSSHPELKDNDKDFGHTVLAQCCLDSDSRRFDDAPNLFFNQMGEGALHILADGKRIGWAHKWKQKIEAHENYDGQRTKREEDK